MSQQRHGRLQGAEAVRTDRLLLREPHIDDADAIFEEYATDPEVTRYLTWVPHRARATVAEFLEGVIARRRTGEEYSWVLTRPGPDRAIGMIGARVLGPSIDIGYVLGRRHWRQGLMSEAIAAITAMVLSQPDIYRVGAVCDAENVGSARALEKAGFEREGLLRRWLVLPNLSAEPRDCYVYARIR
jgi:RimJ/RimL family protein N-acetyltransferase